MLQVKCVAFQVFIYLEQICLNDAVGRGFICQLLGWRTESCLRQIDKMPSTDLDRDSNFEAHVPQLWARQRSTCLSYIGNVKAAWRYQPEHVAQCISSEHIDSSRIY